MSAIMFHPHLEFDNSFQETLNLSKYLSEDEYCFGSLVGEMKFEYFDLENGPWIGGGYMRSQFEGEEARDIDVFFKSHEQWIELYPKIKSRYTNLNFNPVAFVFFENWKSLMDSFDFTCCLGITDGKNFIIKDGFVDSIEQKILKFNNGRYYPTSLKRLRKYLNYGYSPAPGMISQFFHLDTNWKEHFINGKFISLSPFGS